MDEETRKKIEEEMDDNVSLVNQKLTITMARVKAQDYADHTQRPWYIYVYREDQGNIAGHHLVMDEKEFCDSYPDEFDYIDEVQPSVKVV